MRLIDIACATFGALAALAFAVVGGLGLVLAVIGVAFFSAFGLASLWLVWVSVTGGQTCLDVLFGRVDLDEPPLDLGAASIVADDEGGAP